MADVITQAKILLSEICTKHKQHDKDIMLGIAGEKYHALDVLGWVNKLDKQACLALQLAALFHDIDRVVAPKVGGGFKGNRDGQKYFEHKKKHAQRSAGFIAPLLKKFIADEEVLEKISFLIIHHDDIGKKVELIDDSDLYSLVAADNFAFFTSVAPKLYEIEGEDRVREKVKFMIGKMPRIARDRLKEYQIDNKLFNKIKNEVIKSY